MAYRIKIWGVFDSSPSTSCSVGGVSKKKSYLRPQNNSDEKGWRKSDGLDVKLGVKRDFFFFYFFIFIYFSFTAFFIQKRPCYSFFLSYLFLLKLCFLSLFFPLWSIIRNYFLFKFSPINCSAIANESTVTLCFKGKSISVLKLWKELCCCIILILLRHTLVWGNRGYALTPHVSQGTEKLSGFFMHVECRKKNQDQLMQGKHFLGMAVQPQNKAHASFSKGHTPYLNDSKEDISKQTYAAFFFFCLFLFFWWFASTFCLYFIKVSLYSSWQILFT